MLTGCHRKLTCLEVLNFWNSSELRRGFSRENITTIVNAVSAKSTRPQKVPWQLLIKNMSLWESEKSCWHTKKGLFARLCVLPISGFQLSALLTYHAAHRRTSVQLREREKSRIQFFFQALRNWERKRIWYLPSPSPKPFSWPTDHCLLRPFLNYLKQP